MRVLFFLVVFSFVGASAWCQEKAAKQKPVREPSIRAQYKPRGFQNTLTVNLPNLVVADLLPGVSAGLEYERFINRRGTFSISVPAYAFVTKTPNKGSHQVETKGYYVAPALLFHPIGNARYFDYSFGPAIAIGNLQRTEESIMEPSFDRYDRTDFVAVLLTGNFTIHTLSHFIFAVHASGGVITGTSVVHSMLAQAGMKVGFRF